MAAKNEAKIRFSAETKDFDKGIKDANSTLTTLRNELKLNEAQMRNNGVSVDGLRAKQQNLTSQMEAAQDKTKALSDKLAVAVEVFGENSVEATKLRNQLINAQTAEEKLQGAIDKCNAELEQQEQAAKAAESATGKLSDEIGKQESELKKLKDAYVDAVLEFGEGSDEAKNLARKIDDLSGELKDSRNRMNDAQRAADELDRSLDDVGDSAGDAADGGFTVLKGAMADLVSEGIQAVISGLGDLFSYFGQLPQETMEIRQDMGTLITAFDNVGLSTEVATDTWKELYKVFGEDDRAVETANNIARIASNEKELNDWITITTGIWGTYQDSLPVEGLAEAAAETAKTGTVTGGLADALNWSSEAATMFADYMGGDVVTAEDAFNAALAECTTEQERQALITDTLTKLYGGAADKYRDTTSAQMEAKEATAEQILAENDLASAIEPVTTAWQGMKNELLVGILPAVKAVSGALVSALDWLQEHPVVLKVLAGVLGVVAAALTALTIATVAQTVAQWALNSAILANPLTWIIVGIVAAIAAVVAIIIVVIEYWDQIVAAVKSACSAVVSALQAAWDWVAGIFSSIAGWVNANVIQPVVNFFIGLWTKLQEIWNTICNVIQVAFMLIGSIISAAVDIITLPFQFIWENCKEYVFAAWEWISEKVSTAIDTVSGIISTVMEAIRTTFSTIWEGIKNVVATVWDWISDKVSTAVNAVSNVVSSVFNGIKSTATSIWNGIKSAISTVVNGIKSTVTSVFESVKSTATSVWNGIKSAITTPIEAAKEKVKGVIDAIKGFFSGLKLELPNIKLPHFSITGSFSLNPPSVPKLSIQWYKDGGIMTNPTIFGINGNRLMAGGEAGPEAILPIDRLQGYISSAIDKTMQTDDINALVSAVEDLANRPVQLNVNGRQFAVATAADTDSVNGNRLALSKRGLAL